MKRLSLFLFTGALSASLFGQTKGAPMTALEDLKASYAQMKNLLTRAAEKMPEEDYSFQPSKEERNFGGWVAHVADSQMGACSGIAGARKNINAGAKTSKADLTAALKESFDACDAVYAATTDANKDDLVATYRGQVPRLSALYGTIAHDQECYGSMAVYLRLKTIVPPSSERPMGGMGKK